MSTDRRRREWPWVAAGFVLALVAIGAGLRSRLLAMERRLERENAYFQRLGQIREGLRNELPPPLEFPNDPSPEQIDQLWKEWGESLDRAQERVQQRLERLREAVDRGYDPGPTFDWPLAAVSGVCAVGAILCFSRVSFRSIVIWPRHSARFTPARCTTGPDGRRVYHESRLRGAIIAALGLALLIILAATHVPNWRVISKGLRNLDHVWVYAWLFGGPALGIGVTIGGLFLLLRPKRLAIDPQSRHVLCGRSARALRLLSYDDVELVLLSAPVPDAFPARAGRDYALVARAPGLSLVLASGYDEGEVRAAAEEIEAATGLAYEDAARRPII